MEHLYVEGTKMTPNVILDSDKKVYSITGNSRPENPLQFYKPIFEWLTNYLERTEEKMVFEVQMDYFNTSTSKVLLDLFELFEKFAETKDIHVVWYYQSDDEEMQEAGEELLDLVELSHEIKQM
jgi:hypothetical protein